MVSSEKSLIQSENQLNHYGIRGIIANFILIFISLPMLLISAGKIEWLNAYVYFALIVVYEILYVVLLMKINPVLLNERGKLIKEGTKSFDKVYAALYLPLCYLILIISGLDFRYGLSMIPLWIIFSGLTMILVSFFIGLWAMVVNSYFECTVRIQADRNQNVVTNGPYRIVRHPGYIAGIISVFSAPLILGSWWGLVPSFILIIVLVIRTALEDSALQRELAGYNNYSKVTRYRLVPFLW